MVTTSIVSVQWFWRVWILCLIDVDIPQLTSDGIYFGDWCFLLTYSLQSSSTHSLISSSFDATALTAYIMNSQYVPFEISELTKSSKELIIPNNYFNANDIISFKIANKENLKSIVIGDNCFGKVRAFELDGLMIQICQCYNPFDLVHVHLMVIIVMIERRLVMNPSITRTHWQCEVRLNRLMDE